MLLGPLFHVEMVTVARRRRYFFLRALYGTVALLMLWAAYTQIRHYSTSGRNTTSIQQGAQLANAFFMSFSWLQMIVIMVIGPALAVGTIASERERRTIEYLFTTDLSNSEIILGKLVARLCLLGQILLVGLPILFIFRLLGGIPAQLLMVTFLMAASASLLIASLSICISVWSERTRDATIRVYLILGAFTFLPTILQAVLRRWTVNNAFWNATAAPVLNFCIAINPFWGLGTAIGNTNAVGSGLDMQSVWMTIAKQVLVSLAAISLAIFAVRRVHLKESTKAAQTALKATRRRRFNFRFPTWKRPLGDNPMIWKEVFAHTATTKLGIAGRIAAGLILLTAFGIMMTSVYSHFAYPSSYSFGSYHANMLSLSGMLGTGILLLLAARASGLMTSEKESDCWLSLIATSLTGKEIIRGKMWGNFYSMRWPFLLLVSNWVIGVLLAPSYLLAALATLATFLLMAFYVTNLGLLFSLKSQTTMRAMGATLGTLLFTGGGYMFCCCMVGVGSSGGGDDFMIFLAGVIPFLLSFPTIIFLEFSPARSLGETGMPIAYGLGIIGYLIAAICLHTTMARNFDHQAGRTTRGPDGSNAR